MRVFVAAFGAESNSFGFQKMELEDFAACCLVRPGEPLSGETANDGHNDFLEWAEAKDFVTIRGTLAYATPSGPLTRSCYETLRDEILNQIRASLPLDIVLLNLHGAMIAEDYPDCEGDLLERIRALCGDKTVISGLLDPHAHLSRQMLKSATLLLAYKYYPHTDVSESALRLAELSLKAAQDKIRPHMEAVDCKSIGTFPTTAGPMASYVRAFQDCYTSDTLLDVSLIHSFPWGDCPDAGVKTLTISDNDPDLALSTAQSFADRFLQTRDQLVQRYMSLTEALEALPASPPKPVVMADSADNPGGGAPGDATFILEALLDSGVTHAAVGVLYDPETMKAIKDAAVGDKIDVALGGKLSHLSGRPIRARAEVLAFRSDATQSFGHGDDVRRLSLGNAAALRIDGIDIVVNDLRSQTFSPDCFSGFGLDPASYRVIVVKSTNHFRDAFAPIASQIMDVETPGPLTHAITSLPYQHIPRPIWPLDPISEMQVIDP